MVEVEFELTDHNGRAVSPTTYRGRYLLVFFGFTHCRVVCPRALARISQALDCLGKDAEKIRPLYISVDPERDTPAVMQQFLQQYPLLTGLTGTREQVDAAKKAFRVFAEKKPDEADPDGYAVPHTAFTYLIDKNGHFLKHYPDHWDAERLSADLSRRINNDSVE